MALPRLGRWMAAGADTPELEVDLDEALDVEDEDEEDDCLAYEPR